MVVPEIGENFDGFVAKFTPDGSALVYSTLIGHASDDAVNSIVVDAQGSAYVTGVISASWDEGAFPLGFQPEPGYGALDAWVGKLNPDGSNFEWFSYLGGSERDWGFDIIMDHEGNLIVTGMTESADFPISGAVQAIFGGGWTDAFVSKISADGQRLIYSTYLGGLGAEWGFGVAVASSGSVIAVGQTGSTNFPVRNALQETNASIRSMVYELFDAYIMRVVPRPEAPPLRIQRSGSSVLVTWSTAYAGFTLEFRETIGAGTAWNAMGTKPLILGNHYMVVQSATASARFYRLRWAEGLGR
jgi:hypothetical protein